jgi:hypothetical protein
MIHGSLSVWALNRGRVSYHPREPVATMETGYLFMKLRQAPDRRIPGFPLSGWWNSSIIGKKRAEKSNFQTL